MADGDIEMAEPSTSSSTTVRDKKRFEVKKVRLIFIYAPLPVFVPK